MILGRWDLDGFLKSKKGEDDDGLRGTENERSRLLFKGETTIGGGGGGESSTL